MEGEKGPRFEKVGITKRWSYAIVGLGNGTYVGFDQGVCVMSLFLLRLE